MRTKEFQRKIDTIHDSCVALNGMLHSESISPATRQRVLDLKVELEADLKFLLAQENEQLERSLFTEQMPS